MALAAPVEPLPDTFVATREALHRVAEELVAPSRKPHNEIALTVTPGGFGTPPFPFDGATVTVRADGDELVLDRDGQQTRRPLISIADGAALLGADLLPDGLPDDTAALGIDPIAAERLADFYAFAAQALEAFRGGLPESADPSPIILWPEHFDVAFEAGSEEAGERANYGASPGDTDHPEPYLYVGPWSARVEGELWNATGFPGAELSFAELLAADDPAAAALEFFESRARALAA
jgi:hypothetical protein